MPADPQGGSLAAQEPTPRGVSPGTKMSSSDCSSRCESSADLVAAQVEPANLLLPPIADHERPAQIRERRQPLQARRVAPATSAPEKRAFVHREVLSCWWGRQGQGKPKADEIQAIAEPDFEDGEANRQDCSDQEYSLLHR
jgi:hypothetical protein